MEQYQKEITSVVFIVLLMLSIGTLFYHNIEGWNIIDSLYYSTVTLTTVGYGDFVPTKPETKLFTIFYILTGVGVILSSLSILGSHYIQKQQPKVGRIIIDRFERDIVNKIKASSKKLDQRYKKLIESQRKKKKGFYHLK